MSEWQRLRKKKQLVAPPPGAHITAKQLVAFKQKIIANEVEMTETTTYLKALLEELQKASLHMMPAPMPPDSPGPHDGFIIEEETLY